VKEQAKLIGRDQCTITLLTVVDDVAPTNINFEFGLAIGSTHGILDSLYQQAQQNIETLVREHFDGFSVTPVVLRPSGPTHQAIVDYATTHKVDLIVLATHGRSGLAHLLLGSVTERVIRHAPCPVLVVPSVRPAETS
jgi:nucleotide-binding universal stress UspA family protein